MNNTFEILIIVLLLAIVAEVYLFTRPKKYKETQQISMLVDTSVLMDGRVVELAQTGFLLGQVIVPKSVLSEMQYLADGGDHAKRERARLGMDALKQLQDVLGASFTLLQDGKAETGVDDRLISLAKETNSSILTLDYNLNKVAQVEGVKVLNINELAKSLRMMHLPGDTLTIELTQKGQGSDQAVGHLSDGTMVVVEQAKKYIGQSKEIEIIRSLQTDAGKMMFAKLTKQEETPRQLGAGQAANKQPAAGRRQTSQVASRQKSSQSTQKRAPAEKKTQARSQQKPEQQARPKPVSRPRQKQKTSAQREAELIRLVDSQ